MQIWKSIVPVLVLAALWLRPVRADSHVTVFSSYNYDFGERLEISARFESDEPIRQVILFYTAIGISRTESIELEVSPAGQVRYVRDLVAEPLPGFSKVDYWFRAELADRETYVSPSFSFEYRDDSIEWKSISTGRIEVYWREGDLAFAQEIVDVAERGLEQIEDLLWETGERPPASAPIRIYVYPTVQAFQTALQKAGPVWAAGHAAPELRTILVSLAPEDPERRFEIERQIPHELAHLALYELVEDDYARLPAWLNEGIASMNELYPNPDHRLQLNSAFQDDGLLPVENLCPRFPDEAGAALLAYAEAESFTRYLHGRFGDSGLRELVRRYADGLTCQNGAEAALGEPLSRLEVEWRTVTFAENRWRKALTDLAPWLLLLATMLTPLVLLQGIAWRNRRQARLAKESQQGGST